MRSVLRVLLGIGVSAAIAGFLALGVWQIERRAWKHDLIANVDARLTAAPAEAPGPLFWPDLTAGRDAYRRVIVHGTFLHDAETAVQAVTELGPGYWIVTPIRTTMFTVLVNRGFVPLDRRDPATRQAGQLGGEVSISGLLRTTEPEGGFLRANNPAADRWYSRDVAAIARARNLGTVAPYFIDADSTRNPGGLPIGGLTVVTFRDNHLVYAITWFTLAIGLAAASAIALRRR